MYIVLSVLCKTETRNWWRWVYVKMRLRIEGSAVHSVRRTREIRNRFSTGFPLEISKISVLISLNLFYLREFSVVSSCHVPSEFSTHFPYFPWNFQYWAIYFPCTSFPYMSYWVYKEWPPKTQYWAFLNFTPFYDTQIPYFSFFPSHLLSKGHSLILKFHTVENFVVTYYTLLHV